MRAEMIFYIFSFRSITFIYVYWRGCLGEWVIHLCHNMHVEVRRQLVEIGQFSPSAIVCPGEGLQVSRLGSKFLLLSEPS